MEYVSFRHRALARLRPPHPPAKSLTDSRCPVNSHRGQKKAKRRKRNVSVLFPPQLQRPPTESPILAQKADEHHIVKRDVHKNPLAHLTNLVRC